MTAYGIRAVNGTSLAQRLGHLYCRAGVEVCEPMPGDASPQASVSTIIIINCIKGALTQASSYL